MEIVVKGMGIGAAIASAFLLWQGRAAYDFAYLTDVTTACIAIENDPFFGFLPSDQVERVRAECHNAATALVAMAPDAATGLLVLGDAQASRTAAPREAWLAAARVSVDGDETDARTLMDSKAYHGVLADLYRSQPDIRPMLARIAGQGRS